MKRLLFRLLLILVFVIGIYPGVVYAFIEQHQLILSTGADFKYRIYNSIYYFLSLLVVMWLLKYSTKRQKDFVLIGGMYGIASLIYDVVFVQVVGGILLLMVLLKIYFKLFPEEKIWQKDRMKA
jgi:hypothetical protein